MSDDELVERMRLAIASERHCKVTGYGACAPALFHCECTAGARAALAVAEPAIRERCATTLNAEVTLLTKHRDAFERMGNSDSVRAITRDIENTKRFIRAIRTGGTTT